MRFRLPVAALAVLPQIAFAQQPGQEDWPRVKCERYAKATTEALQRFGRTGLGTEFLARHEAFLATGCQGERDVCPKSPEELRLANALVIRGMNAGMASTFFPFACPKGR
ncbi:hypothetical protein [Rhabdaerophilum sp. SD176]|uniref:hypothetical protein n=1 Tax=Rhabdaerophilum sp. SD176 TaxID=2983548 RepID=UPI0024DF4BD5|nr:hypothetical protein [Rhabdaerophilum sp. SD176]